MQHGIATIQYMLTGTFAPLPVHPMAGPLLVFTDVVAGEEAGVSCKSSRAVQLPQVDGPPTDGESQRGSGGSVGL